jgi:hypothetical protein
VKVNRRDFIKCATATGLGASQLIGSSSSRASAELSTSHPGYIRENIPSITYPPHRGMKITCRTRST